MTSEFESAQEIVEAEQVVLGAMMSSDAAITAVEPILGDGEGFYRPSHTTIYRAILTLRDSGSPTDPVALVSHLQGTGEIARIGGMNYLHTCTASVPLVANAAYYARMVAGAATLRSLAQFGVRAGQMASQATPQDAAETVERVRELLSGLDAGGARQDTLRLWSETTPALLSEFERAEQSTTEQTGIATGLHDLDQTLGGLRPGQLVLVGARPRVGKSVLLINLAIQAAIKDKLRTALFSLEMSEAEIGTRIVSAGASIPLQTLRNGKLGELEWTKVARYVAETDDAPLHIDESANVTLAHIRAGVKRVIAQHGGIDLILVDYLQLMGSGKRAESRQQEVSDLSRGLKLLAKETGAPVVAASQLNRGSEHRTDKRPSLADLRESGSLEQDADIVILLHREDANDPESARAGECDMIVAKNRHGPMDTVTVAAQLHLCRFMSMAVQS